MLRKISSSKVTSSQDVQIAIVASQYNSELMEQLLGNCLSTLARKNVRNPKVVRVPGAYEIPVMVAHLAKRKKIDAIIALGVVLQGKTSHAEHITLASSIHLQKIAVESGIPVIHQILTPKNLRDAQMRVRLRGVEAAQTALEMAVLVRGF